MLGRTSLLLWGLSHVEVRYPWTRWESRGGPMENRGAEETLEHPQSADGWDSRKGCLEGHDFP